MNPTREASRPARRTIAITGLAALAITSLGALVAATVEPVMGRADPSPPASAPLWIDSLVEAEALDRGVPGVAVAIVSDGRIVLERGYGVADLETGRPVDAATTFNIASLTKPFTAIAAVRLAARGLLVLETGIATYLPTLPQRYAGITVRHLLTHTSGVDRDLRADNLDDPSAEEYRARLDTASVHAAPGERWEYSNTGYTLLGWVLASAAGRSVGEVLRSEIFRPLGMRGARYRMPPSADPRRARPYDVSAASARPAPYVTGGFGSGGASMSIADLARFGVALQSEDLLTSEQKARMWKPGVLADGTSVSFEMMGSGTSYGFGWFLTRYDGRRLATHGGAISGFSSNLYHFPDERLTIVVLANAKARDDGRAPVDRLARAIASRCLTP